MTRASTSLVQLSLALCIATLGACASGGRISLNSSPSEAKIFIKPLNQRDAVSIGQTPYVGRSSNLEKVYGGAGPVMIEYRKEGYRPTRALITELHGIDFTLNLEMEPEGDVIGDATKLNGIVSGLFEARRLALVKRYDQALAKLTEVEKLNTRVSALHELRGGIYFMQARYNDALDSFRQAIRFDPKNAESARMKQLIEEKYARKGAQ